MRTRGKICTPRNRWKRKRRRWKDRIASRDSSVPFRAREYTREDGRGFLPGIIQPMVPHDWTSTNGRKEITSIVSCQRAGHWTPAIFFNLPECFCPIHGRNSQWCSFVLVFLAKIRYYMHDLSTWKKEKERTKREKKREIMKIRGCVGMIKRKLEIDGISRITALSRINEIGSNFLN